MQSDPFDRRFQVTYGSPPAAVSNADAARASAARRLARARALMSLAAGIGQYDPRGNFGTNLLRGLSGSLQGGFQADQLRHEQERQAQMDAAKAAQDQRDYEDRLTRQANEFERILLERRRVAAEEQKAAKQPGTGTQSRLGSLAGMTPQDFATALDRERQLANARRRPGTSTGTRQPTAKERSAIDTVGLANPSDPAHRDRLNQMLDTETSPVVRAAILRKLLGNMTVRTAP